MERLEFFTIFITLIGIFIAVVSLVVAFWNMMRDVQKENRQFKDQWAQEMKDFHGRLIVLEEERNRILRSRSNLYL
jgi:hypothetical protein